MSVEDSPLRDRVMFVEGAPRSGTTMLISLLAVHPEIAAIVSESRLFDRGVGCLFDNHEFDPVRGSHLASYVSREELRDAVRDLCDRVLITMRDRVKPEARLVAEKTPAQRQGYAETLGRKLECYPDARYLHVVRDREGVVRSLARSPWRRGSEADFEAHWRSAVETAREILAGKPNSLEISYADLAGDPGRTMAGVFAWLDLQHDDAVLERVAVASRERISTHGPGLRSEPRAEGTGSIRTGLAKLARSAVAPILDRWSDRAAVADASELITALRRGDAAGLQQLTSQDFLLVLRSGAGDLRATGNEARESLLDLGRELFGGQFVSESWSVGATSPSVCFLLSALAGDGTRTDLCINVFIRAGQAVEARVISAGDLRGRPSAIWTPSAREMDTAT